MKLKKFLYSKHLSLLVVLAFSLRVLLAWVFGSQVADIEQFYWMANIIANSENIFHTPGLFHYTPIAMFLPYWCLKITEITNLPFHFVIKWPTIFADILILIIIWKITIQRTKSKDTAFLSGMIYATNPISLLITCFHGSYNIIFILFSLFAFALMTSNSDAKYYRLAALSLGFAIGFRGFAILFLPFFVMTAKLDWKKKIYFIIISAFPSVVTLIPFLIVDYQAVLRDTFLYSGVIDFGWVAIARAFWFIIDGNYYLPGTLGDELLNVSKFAFLITYGLLIFNFFYLKGKNNLLIGIISTILLFYSIYGGLSAQYLVWLVPFTVLMNIQWVKIFSIFAAMAMICFYLFYFPKILFGNLPIFWQELNPDIMIFVLISNVLFWGLCLVWLILIIMKANKKVLSIQNIDSLDRSEEVVR